MRKMLQNKKGFTLVELMIVVVIMGILVAVAVPVYNAVTKNARNKACASNISVMDSQAQTYMMTGNNGEAFVGTANASKIFVSSFGTNDSGATVGSADTNYTSLIKGGIETCPSGGTYDVYAVFTTDGFTITSTCSVQTSIHDA